MAGHRCGGWCALLLLCAAPLDVAAASGSTSDALVEEIIAGVEANEALIRHGTATYFVRLTLQRGGVTRVKEGEVREWFDYPNVQWEWRVASAASHPGHIERTMVNEAYLHHFVVPAGFGPTGPPGDACLVFVEGRNSGIAGLTHPREQIHKHSVRPPSFAEQLRYMQSGPGGPVAIRQQDGLIRVDYQPPRDGGKVARGIYLVSPHEGYCLVRADEWPYWPPEGEPARRYEAIARSAGSGAFVLAHRVQMDYLLSETGELVLDRGDDSTLREVNLGVVPEPKFFTLDGLGLPPGTRIRDNVRGREFRYGIASVTEGDILPPEHGSPMALRYWFVAFGLIAGVLAACRLAWRSQSRRPPLTSLGPEARSGDR